MSQCFDYQYYFGKALDQIKAIRDPYAKNQELNKARWYALQEQQVVNIGAVDFARPMDVIDKANVISIIGIYNILLALIAKWASYCKILPMSTDAYEAAHNPFMFIDTNSNRVVIVRSIEKDVVLIKDEYIPNGILELMKETGTTSYAVVYLVHENADAQFVGSGNALHGKSVHSFPWLFDTYFGENEYTCFKDELQKYMVAVNEYLGYSVVRSLNPAALSNFQKKTEHELSSFDYGQILHKTIVNKPEHSVWIKDEAECKKLKQQFLNDGAYRVLLGNHDFAESLTTAEWLFDSLIKADAIDLTVIATGYFKAMEQLLFTLVSLHDAAFDPNSTLGNYAVYYNNHRDQLLRQDVHYSTRNYVREAIFEYKGLRNGYLHKHNIHDPQEIRKIRSATFILMYLLLGCQNFSHADLVSLGAPEETNYDDFSTLCEYIRFHKNDLFCVEPDGYPEQYIKIIPTSEVPKNIRESETSPSIYFQVLGAKNVGRFAKNDAPRRIWSANIKITNSGSIELAYEKIVLVYEDGRYVGPSIAAEEGFSY